MKSSKDISIEYAHIYTNEKIRAEHKISIEILERLFHEKEGFTKALVVMIDDYSFPDPSFDYSQFSSWLDENGFMPDIIIKESQLIPYCDEVLKLIKNKSLKKEIFNYIQTKKYPCSLFIATWYFIRLGHIFSQFFNEKLIAKKLINILPLSFKPFEDKALEIIKSTDFSFASEQIENKYFEGRRLN